MNAAISALLALESREALWTREVLGYPVWAHLRLAQYHRLLGDRPRLPSDALLAARRRILERAPASARDLLTKLVPALRGRDIWVLGSSTYRRPEPDGSSRSIFVKHLEDQLGPRLLFLETNSSNVARLVDRNVVFLDCARDLLRIACGRAGRVLPATLASPITGVLELEQSPRAVLQEALFGRVWRGFAHGLLSQGKPAAVFVLCGYDHHLPFQLAVRQLGVPLIELQHGVIHESHPGYVFNSDFAAAHAPDHLLVFGEHYGKILDRGSSYYDGRWSVAGHPWLKAKRELYAWRRPEELVVIFGQNVPAVQEQVRDYARALRSKLPREVRIVLKPHPGERNASEVYAGLPELGIEVAARGADSYELLGRCRVAVSVYSTIAIEALAFPCKSVVLRSLHWFDDIKRFIKDGFIQVTDSADDIANLLHAPTRNDYDQVACQLFGIGETRLDFEQLILRLQSDGQAARARIERGMPASPNTVVRSSSSSRRQS